MTAPALSKKFLGKRLLAATRLARWEKQLVLATGRAMAEHRKHALEIVSHSIKPVTLTASIPADLFGLDTWGEDIDGALATPARAIYADIRKTTAGKFLTKPGALPEIDVSHRLDRMVGNMADLGPRASARLGAELTEGVNLGESIPNLAQRVMDVFDSMDYEAERIARTEVVGASNELGQAFANAVDGTPDISLQKTWITAGDDSVRGSRPGDEFSHIDADGETVGVNDAFTGTGEELMYPGDEAGSAGNIINCRCTVIYDEAGTDYGDDLRIGYDE